MIIDLCSDYILDLLKMHYDYNADMDYYDFKEAIDILETVEFKKHIALTLFDISIIINKELIDDVEINNDSMIKIHETNGYVTYLDLSNYLSLLEYKLFVLV